MSRRKICLFFKSGLLLGVFIGSGVHAQTKDELQSQDFQVFYQQSSILPVEGITRYHVVDPNLLQIELLDGHLRLRGKRYGKTMLYVWSGNEIQVWLIQIQGKANPRYLGSQQMRHALQKDPQAISGVYSVQANVGVSSQVFSQDKILRHLFVFEAPIFQTQKLLFRTSFNNHFAADLGSINSLNIPQIQFNLLDQNYSFDLGDSFIVNPLSQLASLQQNIKGLSFHQYFPHLRYSLFSGILQNPIYLYDIQNRPSLLDHKLTSGLTSNLDLAPLLKYIFKPSEQDLHWMNFKIGGSLITRQDFGEQTPTALMVNGGLQWFPDKSSGYELNLGSSLNGLAMGVRSFHRFYWEEQKNWLEASTDVKHFGPGYAFSEAKEHDYASIRLNSFLQSGTVLSGNGNLLFSSGNPAKMGLSARIAQNLEDLSAQIYSQVSWLDAAYFKNLRLSFGMLTHTEYPFNLVYRLINTQQISDSQNDWQHQLQGLFQLYRTDFVRLALTENSLYSQNANAQSPFQQELNFFADLFPNASMMIKALIGYQFNYGPTTAIPWQHGLRLNLAAQWWFSPIQNLQLNFNSYSALWNPALNQLSLSAGYSYHFGMLPLENQGKIWGRVFEDLNDNKEWNPGEPFLNTIPVSIDNIQAQQTDQGYEQKDLKFGSHEIRLQEHALPAGYRVSFSAVQSLNLMTPELQYDFPVRQEIIIKGLLFKSTQMSEGFENIELILDNQKRQRSNASGQFFFKAKPGKHTLSVNSLSIPAGYSLQGPLSQEIDSNESISLNIYFQPQISLRGIVYDVTTKKTIGNLQLLLRYDTQDKQIHEETINVSSDGTFFVPNVPDGPVELLSTRRTETLLIQIPPEPGTFKVAVPLDRK